MGPGVLRFLTDFGDQAVVLPAVAVVCVVLLAQRRFVMAGLWVLAVCGVLGTMLVLKLADQSCGWRAPLLVRADLVNPSGHAASATVLWACGAALLASARGWRPLPVAAAAASVVAVGIGITRVALGAHTPWEAVAGGAVGIAGALAFGVLLRHRWLARAEAAGGLAWRRAALPMVAALLVTAVVHGRHAGVEPTLHGFGVRLVRRMIPACQPPAGVDAARWAQHEVETTP